MKSLTPICLITACLAGPAAQAVFAQTTERIVAPTTVRPEAATLSRMQKRLTVSFSEMRLEDIFKYIAEATGADFEVLWTDDRSPEGFNKDTPLSIEAKALPALTLLERIVTKAAAADDITGGATWQMTESGSMQIGPKSRLNKYKRVEVYSIEDLLLDVPNFENAPDFNLQSVLQSGQGGGGQSPFQDGANGQQDDQNRQTRDQKVQEVIDLITKLVETDQWVDNGGDGATITPFRGTLIIDAPDYVHRGVNGYPYWTGGSTAGRRGGRWVGISGRTSNSQVDGITNTPVQEPK
jgi:hypothetical protein